MKLKWSNIVFVSMIAGFSLMSADFSQAGVDNGGGGDAYALEFTATARFAVKRLGKQFPGDSGITTEQVAALAAALDQIRVVSVDHAVLSGAEVDAINYPSEKKIELNRARWDQLQGSQQFERKLALVLHEYFSILGISDAHYRFSSDFIRLVGAQLTCNYGKDAMNKARQCLEEFASKTFGNDYYVGAATGGTVQSTTSSGSDLFLVQLNYSFDTPGRSSVTGMLECNERTGILEINSISYFLPGSYGVRGVRRACQ